MRDADKRKWTRKVVRGLVGGLKFQDLCNRIHARGLSYFMPESERAAFAQEAYSAYAVATAFAFVKVMSIRGGFRIPYRALHLAIKRSGIATVKSTRIATFKPEMPPVH